MKNATVRRFVLSVTRGRAKQWRVLIGATLLSLLCGVIHLGEPLEDVIRGARDIVRMQPASGNIVVVGVDDKTFSRLPGNGSTVTRDFESKVAERLLSLGANRVFFDRLYSYHTSASADAEFEATMRRHPGRVFIGIAEAIDFRSKAIQAIVPITRLNITGQVVSISGIETPFGSSAKLTLGEKIKGRYYPSMSSVLARKDTTRTKEYRADWSIDWHTIPTVSFVDVLDNRVAFSMVRGRDVVIGPTAALTRDIRTLIFQGKLPGVYLQVIGAETLARGYPNDLGWLPLFSITLLGSAGLLLGRQSWRRPILAAMIMTLAVLPFILDARYVAIEVIPALLLALIVAVRNHQLLSSEETMLTDSATGLPNTKALQQIEAAERTALIALKIANLSRVVASFDVNVETQIVWELCRRIRLDATIEHIYHDDDALYWLTPLSSVETLGHHLEGLCAIVATSLAINDRNVDLSIAFGVDADFDRSMVSRIGSAYQCAVEAAEENEIWKVYNPLRREGEAWRLELMGRLEQAAASEELYLVYQPKLNLQTGMTEGAEALLRWHHPYLGFVPPQLIIEAAEEHHRIEYLTCLICEKAISATAEQHRMGHRFGIAVNVPPGVLMGLTLHTHLLETLARHGLSPSWLTLEITENGTLASGVRLSEVMHSYHLDGIKVSIDDFGSGSATLERLRALSPDEIKLDRQFISDVDQDEQKQALVRGTIEMAHSMRLRVVAEGIERPEELAILRAFGCDAGQGFLIGHPGEMRVVSESLQALKNDAAQLLALSLIGY